MKYIVFSLTRDSFTQEFPVIFPDTFVHADVAGLLLAQPQLTGASIVSAGECLVDNVLCCGSSKTLGLSSREEDTQLLNMYDYFHGIK